MKSNITNLPSFEWRYEINQTLLIKAFYTLIPTGVAFNMIQIFVYLRQKFSKNSMCIYLVAISLNNIFVLVSTALRFANSIEKFDYEENTDIGCRMAQFFIRLFYHGCSWLNFLFTLDRL
ncbi:hypothetical protein BpHYR1_045611, partial [Brachionus plicatilis]